MVLDLLGTLHRERGCTIVMVTHDPTAAARAQFQLHLDKGSLARIERGDGAERVP
jgi:predicted ABC-type transport system involved in lysophospholipase L1 biosynthesis ATPase subunit